jgi:preflagellin peptidase FlaK
VDYAEAISATRLLVAFAILAVASVLDVRTRKVSNTYWILMAAVGLGLLPVQIAVDDMRWEYLLVFVPILAVLSDVYLEGKSGSRFEKLGPVLKYGVAVTAVVVIGYLWGSEPYFQHFLAVPIMMLVVVALYMLDLIRGGADAKALISLSLLFPFYPAVAGLPAIQGETELSTIVFPFAFTILINAAIIVAVVMPLGFLLSNVVAGDMRFPNVFLGRRINVDRVLNSHVWLMERIEDGKHIAYSKPRREEDLSKELDLLKGAGVNRVWVTPKIPFMVPMLASLVLSALIGNVLALLFPL